MSVMQLSPLHFKAVSDGIQKYSYKYDHGKHTFTDNSKPYIETLQRLNAKSYSLRYKEISSYKPFSECDGEHLPKNISALLKLLQCIQYNIDTDDIKPLINRRAVEFLTYHINTITEHIILHLSDYKQADWSI